jgi:hypothetical protein
MRADERSGAAARASSQQGAVALNSCGGSVELVASPEPEAPASSGGGLDAVEGAASSATAAAGQPRVQLGWPCGGGSGAGPSGAAASAFSGEAGGRVRGSASHRSPFPVSGPDSRSGAASAHGPADEGGRGRGLAAQLADEGEARGGFGSHQPVSLLSSSLKARSQGGGGGLAAEADSEAERAPSSRAARAAMAAAVAAGAAREGGAGEDDAEWHSPEGGRLEAEARVAAVLEPRADGRVRLRLSEQPAASPDARASPGPLSGGATPSSRRAPLTSSFASALPAAEAAAGGEPRAGAAHAVPAGLSTLASDWRGEADGGAPLSHIQSSSAPAPASVLLRGATAPADAAPAGPPGALRTSSGALPGAATAPMVGTSRASTGTAIGPAGLLHGHASGLELSLCGGALRPGLSYAEAAAAFDGARLSEEGLLSGGAALLSSPELFVRTGGGHILPWAALSFQMAALLAFGVWRPAAEPLSWAPPATAAALPAAEAPHACAVGPELPSALAAALAAAAQRAGLPAAPAVERGPGEGAASRRGSAGVTPKKAAPGAAGAAGSAAAASSWRLWPFGGTGRREAGARVSGSGVGLPPGPPVAGSPPPPGSPVADGGPVERQPSLAAVTKKSLTAQPEQLATLPLRHGQNTIVYR